MFLNYSSQLGINKSIRLLAIGLSLTIHAGLIAFLVISGFKSMGPASFVSVDLIGGIKEVISAPSQIPKPTVAPKKKPQKAMSSPSFDSHTTVGDNTTTDTTTDTTSQVDSYQLDQYLGNIASSSDPKSIYFTKIFRQISRVKSYPAMARQLSIQGQVKLMLQISSEGDVLEVKAIQYDHEILKHASLDAIKKAGKFDKPPFQIQGSSFSLIIPLRYQIK
jgi:TonB family protein